MKLDRSVIYRVVGRPAADDRPALPPGHPVSWGALTDGTVLQGSAYPIPPFLARRDDHAHRRLLALATQLGEEIGAARSTKDSAKG